VRRTAFNTPSLLPCLLATREATCANSTSYRGNFPSLDVLPWACHWAGRGEVESEESPTGRVPTRTPHTSRKGASPAARMAPWALAWLPAVTPRSPSRPSRPTKNAKRAARRHSVPPLAAPLPERNPEVLTAALSCWNWLIAATPRQQLGRISPAYSAKWLNNLKSNYSHGGRHRQGLAIRCREAGLPRDSMSSVTSCIGNLGAGPSASCLSQSQWAVLRGRGRKGRQRGIGADRRFDRLWPAGNRTMPVSRLQLGAGRQEEGRWSTR
jgi:hypothetical protein